MQRNSKKDENERTRWEGKWRRGGRVGVAPALF